MALFKEVNNDLVKDRSLLLRLKQLSHDDALSVSAAALCMSQATDLSVSLQKRKKPVFSSAVMHLNSTDSNQVVGFCNAIA